MIAIKRNLPYIEISLDIYQKALNTIEMIIGSSVKR
jgi:hypothetical protein